MRPFSYTRAATATAATAGLLAHPDARVLAGGTNLIDLMKDDVEQPSRLIDIRALPYRGIESDRTRLRIGALETMADTADHPLVAAGAPAIASALLASASPQLRNAATIGGNVLQRTRCSYFRDTASPCNKRAPGTGCAAIGGENRMHAVVGGSDSCICTHPSDLAVALMALGASVRVRAATVAAERRTIPLADFYRLPANTPAIETVLGRGELIVAVDVPLTQAAARSTYLKIRDRASYEFALVSIATAVSVRDGRIAEAGVAIGGIAPVPWRSADADAALVGHAPTQATFEAAADAALSGARGYGHNDFKIGLARRAIVRALSEATA